MAMDEFFAEERVFYDKTGSYVRLTADAVHEEGIGFSYAGDVKVKLKLPRTEKKLNLTFESNPEQQRDSIDRDLEESPSQAAKAKEYYTGIQTTIGDEQKWRLKPAIGFKFSMPIDIFLRLRADRSYRTKYWLFRPSMTLYTFKEKGFGGDASFDLNYKINDDMLFRSSTFMRYKEENDYFEPSQVFSVIQSLSDRRAVAYQVGVYGVSEPTWLATEYLLQMRYRQNIHSNYLFMEVIPKLIYDRSKNFDSAMSVTLRLEMVFEG